MKKEEGKPNIDKVELQSLLKYAYLVNSEWGGARSNFTSIGETLQVLH